MEIILASKSPRRKELLQYLNVQFSIKESTEPEFTKSKLPHKICMNLATFKADNVFKTTSGDRVIIGCDTIVFKNHKVFGKPQNKNDAIKMLQCLNNDYHYVYTGLCVIYKKGETIKKFTTYDKTKVYFDNLSFTQIQNYVESGDPFDKAGGYGVQNLGSKFIKKINGNFYSVMGLPVNKLYRILNKLNIID